MNRYCEKCMDRGVVRLATERHHKFSQTKHNRGKYGKLLDHPDNIQYLCYECHHNKSLDKMSEREFLEAVNERV